MATKSAKKRKEEEKIPQLKGSSKPQIPRDALDKAMELLGVPISVTVAILFKHFGDGAPSLTPEQAENAYDELKALVVVREDKSEDVRDYMDTDLYDSWAAGELKGQVRIADLLPHFQKNFSDNQDGPKASMYDIKSFIKAEAEKHEAYLALAEPHDDPSSEPMVSCQEESHEGPNEVSQPRVKFSLKWENDVQVRRVYKSGPLKGEEVQEGEFILFQDGTIERHCYKCRKRAKRAVGPDLVLFYQPLAVAELFRDLPKRRAEQNDKFNTRIAGAARQRGRRNSGGNDGPLRGSVRFRP